METILRPIVRRFGQPVVLSFCIAWIFWNWEIVLALIWYDQVTIPKLGSDNYVEYIKVYKDIKRNYLYPFSFALVYPVLTVLFNVFYAVVLKYDRKLSLNILKTTIVPMSKYLDAQKELEDREKSIGEFITKKEEMDSQLSRFRNENASLGNSNELIQSQLKISTTNLTKLTRNLNAAEELLFVYNEKSTPEYFIGTFVIYLHVNSTNSRYRQYDGGKIEIIKESNSDEYLVELKSEKTILTFYISKFFYNINLNDFFIQLIPLPQNIYSEIDSDEFGLIEKTLLTRNLFIKPHMKKIDSFIFDSIDSSVKIEIIRQIENTTNSPQKHPDPS